MFLLSGIISWVIAVAGNLSLVWLFLSALMWPSLHGEFIQNTGALIFLIEFFSIFSSGFAMGIANEGKPSKERNPMIIMRGSFSGFNGSRPMTPGQMKWFVIAICVVAVGGVGLATKNWVLPLIFFVGLISKFFASRTVENPARFALSVMALIILAMVGVVVAIPFGFFISLSDDGGILVWGVLYYFALAFMDSAFFFHKEISLVWKPFYYCTLGLWRVFVFLMKRSPQKARFSGAMQHAFESAESGGFEKFLKTISPQGGNTHPPDRVVY